MDATCDSQAPKDGSVKGSAWAGVYVKFESMSGDSLAVVECGFTRTSCNNNLAGGGIYFSSAGTLTVDRSSFITCKADNGWGAAIYAKAGALSFNDVLSEDINSQYSVVHFDRFSGNPSPLTLRQVKFNRVTVEYTGNNGNEIQCGGSGLALRYCSALTLEECQFTSCSSKANHRKAAGALLLERQNTGDVFSEIRLKKCTFTGSPGKGGCIYISNTVTKFVVDVSTTVDGCGGQDADHPWSIYVNSREVSFTGLTVKGMGGGHGRIWLGNLDTNKAVMLANCNFGANWRTNKLFDKSSSGDLALSMTSCQFTTVTFDGTSLWEQGGKILTVTGCTFSSITGTGSGACLFKSTGGSVFISGTTKFQNLQIPAEALRFDNTAVSVDNVQFEGGKMAEALRVSGGKLQKCTNLEFISFPDMSGESGLHR